jgi:hypothetical protein
VAAYSGSGSFPYWLSIQGDGIHSNPGMESEQVPVTVGVAYTFTVTAEFFATFSGGCTATIAYYEANGTEISSVTANSGSMAGGSMVTWSTGASTAPALSSYAVLFVQASGNPAAANPFLVYSAQGVDQNGTFVNLNYAFSYTGFPWAPVNPSSTTVTWQYNPLLTNDSDSLVLSGAIELMGGQAGVPCQVPNPGMIDSNGVGPTFRILAPPSLNSAAFGYEPSYDLNAPQPTQDVVASMLLDGERPFGYRSSNRTMSLPIMIFGTYAGGMQQVLAAQEYLMSIIDQQVWQIKWTPSDTGLPMIFDCFRALPSSPLWGFNYSAGGSATDASIGKPNYPLMMITLTVQALPYGRSDIDGVQNLAFTNGLVNGPTTAGAVTLDTYTYNTGGVRRIGSGTSGGTSMNLPVTIGPVPVGDGVVVAVTAPNATAQTISCSDTRGNPYTLTETAQNSTSPATGLFVFTSPNVKKGILPGVDTITVTTSNSQNMAGSVFGVSGFYQVDTAATNTATGNSAVPAVSSNTGTLASNVVLALFSNNNTQVATTPTGWASVGNEANGAAEVFGTWTLATGTNSRTATSSYSSASPYAAVMLVCNISPGYTWNLESQYSSSSPDSGQAAHYATPTPMHTPWPAAVYTGLFSSPVSIVGLPVFTVWFGQAYDTQWPAAPNFVSNVTLKYVLTDTQGRTLSFSTTYKKCKYGANPTMPKWTQINASVPQGDQLFSYDSVTGYTLTVTNWSGSGHNGYVRMHCWLNELIANPQTLSNPVSPRGTVYQLFGLPGSARAPINVQCQLPAAAEIVKEITTPASGNWIVPPYVYQVQAECFGGGGAGATCLSYDGSITSYSPVAWWKLGTSALDYSGNGHTLTTTALTQSQTNSSVVGNDSTSFNGSSSKAVAPFQLSGLQRMTVSGWVNLVGGGQASTIIANSNTVSDNQGFTLNISGTAPFTASASVGNGSSHATATGASAVPSNGWTHLGFTWDGTTVRLYVNGSQAGTAALAGALGLGTANEIGIGFNPQTASGFFAGLVQEVAILPTVLSAAQMLGLANAGCAIGGGGGGGEYACEPLLNVMPGIAVPWSIGAGGQPAQLENTVVQFTDVGQSHWTCPPNVTQVTVECWGAGGAGAAGGGGGGGGGYSQGVQTVVPGTTYYLNVGVGGKANTSTAAGQDSAGSTRNGGVTWFGNNGNKFFTTALVGAQGGDSGITGGTSGGYPGTSGDAIGSITWPGGRGGGSPGPAGGGGGGAGGLTGPGGAGGDSPASATGGKWVGAGVGGYGTGAGGDGGAGAPAPGFPGVGQAPGGGGGGGYTSVPLVTTTAASKATSSAAQVNYLGANGANGMVQLTYSVNVNGPTNGTSTAFGSSGTTGTTVTAHGGLSAGANVAVGAAGGSGSANTIHNSGGAGALDLTTAQGSWMQSPTQSTMQSLSSTTYVAGAGTTGTAASSCALGSALVLIESTAFVPDLQVSDSAGNFYQLVDYAEAGATASGATVYAYAANIEYPIVSSSTTVTVSSATAQQYGVLWFASPYMLGGADTVNVNGNSGNGTTLSAQFGVTDSVSMVYQLGICLNDDAESMSNVTNSGTTWYPAASTNGLTANNLRMEVYTMTNQAGGTGSANSGDVFTTTISPAANWAVLCIPMLAANQTDAVVKLDWKTGTSPGASTSWTNLASISANGVIVVLGMAGSGASITAAPSAVTDASGNTYTLANNTVLPSGYGTMFAYTAPVTHALAAGTTGSIHWGTASGAPEYWASMYWLPGVVGLDSNGASGTTGVAATGASASYMPRQAGDMVLSLAGVIATSETFSNQSAPWNAMDSNFISYLRSELWAAQMTENNPITSSPAWNSSGPWAMINIGFTNSPLGGGGGAAGGPYGPGYPATTWQFGGPAYAGGGKGGQGAGSANVVGGGAGLPGGGGAGAYSNSTAEETGGTGGNGMVRLTWEPPLVPFNTLIVHRPGQGATPLLNPICPIPITDIPNNTEYTIPSLMPQLNASFNSTYTVILCNYHWDSPNVTTARQLTVTINQYPYPGGPPASVQVTRSITPATDVVNGIIGMGEVTLPINDFASYNDQAYFTVAIADTDTADRFMDVLFLDTTGQTILTNIDPGQPSYGQFVNYFYDEATADRDLGFMGASFQDRQHSVSVLPYTSVSGGALYITPGDNLFMAYSPTGSPNLSVTYAPRWYLSRSQ